MNETKTTNRSERMDLFNEQGKYVCKAKSCRRPKFSEHRGRTWDSTDKIIDGKVVEWYYDTTWGTNLYFEWNQKWYVTPIIRDQYYNDNLAYKEKLFTTNQTKTN